MTAPAGPIALFPKSEHGKSNGTLKSTDQTFQLLPSGSTATGHEDEVIVYNYTQMVPDPNGRLCKLSLLQEQEIFDSRAPQCILSSDLAFSVYR